MNTVEVTLNEVFNLARHLPQSEKFRLISQLADEAAEEAQSESAKPQTESIQLPPSNRSLSDFIAPEDAEMAAATASLEAAWKETGMTEEKLLAALEESRKRVALREFGELLNIQP